MSTLPRLRESQGLPEHFPSKAPTQAPTQVLREALEKAMDSAPRDGGLRAFATGRLTCVVRWQRAEAEGFFNVEVRFREDARTSEHSTSLSDLSLLPRWCEHHARVFARG